MGYELRDGGKDSLRADDDELVSTDDSSGYSQEMFEVGARHAASIPGTDLNALRRSVSLIAPAKGVISRRSMPGCVRPAWRDQWIAAGAGFCRTTWATVGVWGSSGGPAVARSAVRTLPGGRCRRLSTAGPGQRQSLDAAITSRGSAFRPSLLGRESILPLSADRTMPSFAQVPT